MIKYIAGITGIALILAIIIVFTATPLFAEFPEPPVEQVSAGNTLQTAVLAGGCFWGVEAVFEHLEGVIDVESGYAGGSANTAYYEAVCSGKTGHAESVKITYDSSKITYGTLLKVFFSIAHDPTQFNYQGPDKGSQYRSAIFYNSAEQKQIAETYIQSVQNAHVFWNKIVTEVEKLDQFYPAEKNHQDFMAYNLHHPYIVRWDKPKIDHLKAIYPELLKK